MKSLLVIVIALMLSGCSFLSKPMTRLLPKLDKIDLPEELMKAPQPLKIIVKPDPPPAQPAPDAPTADNVPPKG